jgi:hypothetical protein
MTNSIDLEELFWDAFEGHINNHGGPPEYVLVSGDIYKCIDLDELSGYTGFTMLVIEGHGATFVETIHRLENATTTQESG